MSYQPFVLDLKLLTNKRIPSYPGIFNTSQGFGHVHSKVIVALADADENVRLAKLRVSRRDAIKASSNAYADTVVLIRPERRRTLTTTDSQYRIPRIEVRRRDTVASRKRATGIPFDGGGILDALCRYAGLRRPRGSHTCGFCCRR